MKKAFLLVVFLGWSCTAQAQGKIQDGLYKIYSDNTIENLASCKKLKLDGVVFEYYQNGDIKRQSWYINNQLHGPTKMFSDKHELLLIKTYDSGKLVKVEKFGPEDDLNK